MIKTRKTHEGTPTSMQVDPRSDPWGLQCVDSFNMHNSHLHSPSSSHGCGDDLNGYGMTKMDAVWALRSAYHEAQEHGAKLMEMCQNVSMGHCPTDGCVENDIRVHAMRGKAKVTRQYSDVEFCVDGLASRYPCTAAKWLTLTPGFGSPTNLNFL